MITDTAIDDLEDELRALYATVEPPPRPRSFASEPAPRGKRTTSVVAGGRRRVRRRLIAVSVIAAIAVAAAVFVRSRLTAPAAPSGPASLTVFVLPSGGQLNCTIGVSALSDPNATGFITFTQGHAAFHRVATNGNTYVPGLHRWVDTTPQMVAPDGKSYVTGGIGLPPFLYDIDVVDSTGTHTVLKQNNGELSPLGYSAAGIVLLGTAPTGEGPPQTMPIVLLDPQTGAMRRMPNPVYPHVSALESSEVSYQGGTNSVYLQAYDPSSNVSIVSRYDLAIGVTTTWFDGHADGLGAAQPVAETATGEPIIQVATRDVEHIAPTARGGIQERTLLMTSPHQAQILNQGPIGDAGVANNLSPLSAIDGNDVWLAGDDGTLWRYEPSQGLRAVAAIRTSTTGAPGVSISGPCV